MTEHDLQNQIRLELSSLGYLTFRINVGKVQTIDGRWFDTGLPKGFSDLMVLKNGKTYFIEVKVGKNKPSQEQENFIKIMNNNGFTAGVVWNMDDVKKLIGGYEK